MLSYSNTACRTTLLFWNFWFLVYVKEFQMPVNNRLNNSCCQGNEIFKCPYIYIFSVFEHAIRLKEKSIVIFFQCAKSMKALTFHLKMRANIKRHLA